MALTRHDGLGNKFTEKTTESGGEHTQHVIVDSGGGGGTQYTEDAASAGGEALSLAGAVRRDTAASSSGADGDYSTINTDSSGRLWVNASGAAVPVTDNNSTLSVDDGAGSLTVDGAVTANAGSGTFVVGDGGGAISVDDNGGSLTVDGTVAISSLPASTGTIEVVGDVAHDAVAAGNPVRIGAKAETAISGVTLVADGDASDLFCGVDGVLITRPHCNLEDIVSGNASNTDGSSTQVIAAAGAGIKQYLTSVGLTNTSSTNTYCELKSGTTVRATFSVPANGGVVFSWAVPLPPNAANEAWNFDPGAAVTTMYCSMVGFKSKV